MQNLFIQCSVLIVTSTITFSSLGIAAPPKTNSECELLFKLTSEYLGLHIPFEREHWDVKMGLPGSDREREAHLNTLLQAYVNDPSRIPLIEEELKRTDLTPETRTGLEGWLGLFRANAIENPEARAYMATMIGINEKLETARQAMGLGYTDPKTGKFVRAETNDLGLTQESDPDEATRKAAYEARKSVGPFVLRSGLIDVIKSRNHLAKLAGYQDFLDYRARTWEGISKDELFVHLDRLEQATRESASRYIESVRRELGEDALRPWNFSYRTRGELTARVDPYFPFAFSLQRSGQTFAGMGIKFQGAKLTNDLLEREGKYNNGFMRTPVPTYVVGGRRIPAEIVISANAVAGKMGAGKVAMATLMHENGHAAHFANLNMPSPAFNVELPPSSIAHAELQSMFSDALMTDPFWLARYARTTDGQPMPADLILEVVRDNQRRAGMDIRGILAVSYLEKALYEMSDAELTSENIQRVSAEIERKMLFMEGGARPLLSVPHIISFDSSGYYHAYALARTAALQTTKHFKLKYGHIVDNAKIGPELSRVYWEKGNADTFIEFVRKMTGEEFSPDALSAYAGMNEAELSQFVKDAIDQERRVPRFSGPIELDAEIVISDGADEIASSSKLGSFEALERKFREWILEREAQAKAAAAAASVKGSQ